MLASSWSRGFRNLGLGRLTAYFCVFLIAVISAVLEGGVAYATLGVNDYPSNLASAPKDSVVDPWKFYNRECTSFVAWHAATAIAVGGNTQMYIGTNSAVYAKNTIGYMGWTPETTAGNAIAIAAEGNGTQLFLRNDSAVFATNSIGGTWTQETDPGSASAIAAG